MQSAFARFRLFPPPATRAPALPGLDGARAGRAADARVLPVVQRIVRQGARADEFPHLALAPLKERAHLVEAVLSIPFLARQARALRGLLVAHARDPGGEAGDGAAEGLHLADAAALQARLQAL